MIFLDQSGKRWKRIKHSAAAITLLATVPVLALIGGSLAYHPAWGALPLVKQVAAVVSHASTKPANSTSSTMPKPMAGVTNAKPQFATQQVAYQPGVNPGVNSNSAVPPSVVPASTSSPSTTTTPPSTTPTQPQSVSPTGGNPTQNDFGQSHKPLKP